MLNYHNCVALGFKHVTNQSVSQTISWLRPTVVSYSRSRVADRPRIC